MNVPWQSNRGPLERAKKRGNRSLSSAAAFSLIELLIVGALILILFSMFFGFGSRSAQQTQIKACQKNLLNIHVALEMFANDHQGAFPEVAGASTAEEPLSLLVPRYTVETKSFICPGSKDSELPSGEPFVRRKISYAYVMGRHSSETNEVLMTDRQIDGEPKAGGQPTFSITGKAPGNNHHKFGGNYLFVDGHAETGPATAAFPVVWPQGAVLLNPKP